MSTNYLDAYIRILLPLNASRQPDFNVQGHYELQVNGNPITFPLDFDSHTSVAKPVFSYGGFGNAGYLRVYSDDQTANVNSDILLCKFKFHTTLEQVVAFRNGLLSAVSYAGQTPSCSFYRVTAAPFNTYSDAHINSFYATAAWANMLGYSDLLSFYNSHNSNNTDYQNYSAWNMFNQCYEAWSFCKLL